MSTGPSSVSIAWFTELVAQYPGAASFRKEFDGLVDELLEANQQSEEDVKLLNELQEQLRKSTDEVNRLKTRYETGEHPLAWFDRLTAEFPGAEKYKDDLSRLFSNGEAAFNEQRDRANNAEQIAARAIGDLRGQDRLRGYLMDFTVAVFEKAAAYTTLVVSLGFVGLFSAWGNTHSQLTDSSNRLVGVFIIIALASFVGFEIYKMFVGHRMSTILIESAAAQGAEFDERVEKFSGIKEKMQGGHNRIFNICLAVSVLFGGGAAAIMLWSYMERFFL